MLKKVLITLVALVAILIVVIAIQPAEYEVKRSATVEASPDVVYALVSDFRRWRDWSPWDEYDPDMKRTYSGAESGKGAIYEWQGNDEVGKGRMSITAATPGKHVATDLHFIEPFDSRSTGAFDLAADGSGTKVTWSMKGNNNFMGKAFSLLVNMDEMVGKDFERGLVKMGKAAKAEAARRAEANREAEAEAAKKKAAEEAAKKAAEEAAAAAVAGEPGALAK